MTLRKERERDSRIVTLGLWRARHIAPTVDDDEDTAHRTCRGDFALASYIPTIHLKVIGTSCSLVIKREVHSEYFSHLHAMRREGNPGPCLVDPAGVMV